jgi:hypothetical protein
MTVRRVIACILLPTYLAACMSWQAQEAGPQQVLAEKQPNQVLVKLADGSKLVLDEPAVSGDTLVGFAEGERASIPLDDVSALEIKETDVALTIGGVVGVLVVAAGLIAGITLATAEW